jgi:tetratricopeptide (TPR) repeat protein
LEADPRVGSFVWDGTRALALCLFGPERPEVWAALSRTARSYLDLAFSLKSSEKKARKICLRIAASLALGAIGGFKIAAGAKPPAAPIPAAELSFARETLDMALRESPFKLSLLTLPALSRLLPALSPAEAQELMGLSVATALARAKPRAFPLAFESVLQAEEPFPSAETLRDALARAEGPAGPGPDSKEALGVRSRLGLELWDEGDRASAAEATEALREAAEGLARLLGPEAPESLSAKERLARRLVGLNGFGRIPPLFPRLSAPDEIALGLKLAQEIKESAPASDEGETLLASIKKGGATELAVTRELLGKDPPGAISADGENDLAARKLYDLALASASSEDKRLAVDACAKSLSRRWVFYGGRHPETASSLALLGDLYKDENGRGLPYWALALEAVGGLRARGGRHAIMAAELLRRIGMVFLETSDHLQAASVFREADAIFRSRRPDDDPERLELAALVAHCLACGEDYAAAREEYRALEKILSKAPPRLDPDPRASSADSLQAMCLAGIAFSTILLGEDAKAKTLLQRAKEIRDAPHRSKKASRDAEEALASPDAPRSVKLLSQAARLRRRDLSPTFAGLMTDALLENFGLDATSFPD